MMKRASLRKKDDNDMNCETSRAGGGVDDEVEGDSQEDVVTSLTEGSYPPREKKKPQKKTKIHAKTEESERTCVMLSLQEFVETCLPAHAAAAAAFMGDVADNNDSVKNKNPKERQQEKDLSLIRVLVQKSALIAMKAWFQKARVPFSRDQSWTSLVDDVVWSLVQFRERFQNHSTATCCDFLETFPGGGAKAWFRRHLLCQGYRIASDNHYYHSLTTSIQASSLLEMTRLNNTVDHCKISSTMQALHQLLGDDIVRTLLLYTQIFLPLPLHHNKRDPQEQGQEHHHLRNFLQMTGPPLSSAQGVHPYQSTTRDVAAAVEGDDDDDDGDDSQENTIVKSPASNNTINNCRRGGKRRKRSRHRPQQQQGTEWDPLAPTSCLSRQSLFYSNAYLPKPGLPRDHVLNHGENPAPSNNKQNCESSSSTACSSMPQEQEEHSKRLLEAMFAEASSTTTPSTRHDNSGSGMKGGMDSPQRLAMSSMVLQRHKSCDYHRLLNRTCPLPDHLDAMTLADLATEGPLSHDQVQSFVSACIKHVFIKAMVPWTTTATTTALPEDSDNTMLSFFGSSVNADCILDRHLSTFLRLRRHERFPNKTLMHGIHVTHFRWLIVTRKKNRSSRSTAPATTTTACVRQQQPVAKASTASAVDSSLQIENDNDHDEPCRNQRGKTPTTKNKKKKNTLSHSQHETLRRHVLVVLRWLFRDYIGILLRSLFYMTESEFSARRVLYYRKPVWARFRTLSLHKLVGGPSTTETTTQQQQYRELSANEAADCLAALRGPSRLRLVPKATGVRPIALLSSRSEPIKNDQSQQSPLLQVANAEKSSVSTANVVITKHTSTCHECPLFLEDEDNHEQEHNDDAGRDIEASLAGPAHSKKKEDKHRPTSSGERSTMPPSNKRQKKGDSGGALPSTNEVLANSFAVLQFEQQRNKDSFGAGIHGMHYFYSRYLQFLGKVRPLQQKFEKKLYFASVDIQHCYDSIDQEYLLKVVDDLLKEDDYLIQRYLVIHPVESMASTARRRKQQVGPPEDFTPFYSTVQDVSRNYTRSVFVDSVSCIAAKKEQIMKQIREHITCNVVVASGRNGDRHLLQSTGIPQGSVLSSLLCNFFYGSVEKKLFGNAPNLNLINSESDVEFMVRMVDDFLFVTTDLSSLQRFLRIMYKGDPRLGVKINKKKTCVSADVTIMHEDGTVDTCTASDQSPPGFFPWCGMLLGLRNGEVRVDYTRFHDGKAGDGLTVERANHEGRQLAIWMKTFVRPRCRPVLFDSDINSIRTQATNFYQLFALAAVKTIEYLQSSDMMPTLMSNVGFLMETIDATILFAHNLVAQELSNCRFESTLVGASSSLENKTNQHKRKNVTVKKRVVMWLGWSAFCDVFKLRKQFMTLISHCKERRERQPLDGHELFIRGVCRAALDDMQVNKLLSAQESRNR